MACSDQISTQDLENAKLDSVTLGEVSTSRAGAESGGAPITESTNRFNETTDTIQGRLNKLGVLFDDPIRDWSASLLVSDLRAHRYPATTGDVYIPVKPLPFTTGGTFNTDDWVLLNGYSKSVIDLLLINDLSQAYEFDTRQLMISSAIVFPIKKRFVTKGFNAIGGGGGAEYINTSGNSPEPLISPDLISNYAKLSIKDNKIIAEQVGLLSTEVDNQSTLAFLSTTDYDILANNNYPSSALYVLPNLQGKGTVEYNGEFYPFTKRNSSPVPSVHDLHFGTLRGFGWNYVEIPQPEAEDFHTSAITSGGGAGSYVINVDDSSWMSASQLIVLLGDDGIYRTNVIDSIAALVVTLKDSVDATSSIIHNAYANDTHANILGYRAIADDIVFGELYKDTLISTIAPSGLNGGTATLNVSTSYANPGSLNVNGYTVATNGANGGIQYKLGNIKEAGAYRLRVELNTNSEDLDIIVRTSTGLTIVNDTGFKKASCKTVELEFFYAGDADYFVEITDPNASVSFFVGDIRLYQASDSKPELDFGRHVLLGDSWFAQEGIFERLLLTLPNATIINKGVGGNTAANLLDRFDADVTTNHPNFVWLMVGTNDFNQGVSPTIFNFQVNKLRMKCAEIGAELIYITPSVGKNQTTAFIQKSREYAKQTNYWDGNYDNDDEGSLTQRYLSFDNVEVVNGTSRRFGYAGLKDGVIQIDRCYFSFSVDIVESTDIKEGAGADTVIGSIPAGTSVDLRFTTSANRFICFKHTNGDVVPRFITGFCDYKV